jgi:hypothetical protein
VASLQLDNLKRRWVTCRESGITARISNGCRPIGGYDLDFVCTFSKPTRQRSCSRQECMPTAEAILAGATSIANEWRALAVAWHIVLAVVFVAGLKGWRPSNRQTAYVLVALVVSVSAAAWTGGNPFNGTVFAVLSLTLVWLSNRVSADAVRFAAPLVAITGVVFIAFGLGYPHFVATDRWIAYAYSAPLGLLPCPTLSAVIGATLLFGSLGSNAWSIPLVIAGFVYGSIGVFVLGVKLDYVLLAGTLALFGVLTSFHLPLQSSRRSRVTSNRVASRGMP